MIEWATDENCDHSNSKHNLNTHTLDCPDCGYTKDLYEFQTSVAMVCKKSDSGIHGLLKRKIGSNDNWACGYCGELLSHNILVNQKHLNIAKMKQLNCEHEYAGHHDEGSQCLDCGKVFMYEAPHDNAPAKTGKLSKDVIDELFREIGFYV